jgi:hypothetical protein
VSDPFSVRDSMVGAFRREIARVYGVTLFPEQAQIHLASEGLTILPVPALPSEPSIRLLVPMEKLLPMERWEGEKTYRISQNDYCYVRRAVIPRPGGTAHVLSELAGYKAGKTFGAALWMAGFAAVPGTSYFVGYEYATSEPEWDQLCEFLLSERGMRIKPVTFLNDRRGGRMLLVLPSGHTFAVKSWERKEVLKGRKLVAYCYCLPLDAPVWMGDFSFKRLEEIRVGDEIIGMDRKRLRLRRGGGKIVEHARRMLARATVTAIHRTKQEVFRLTMASGHVAYCTDDHRWLSGRTIGHDQYIRPRVGAQLVRLVEDPGPPPKDTEWLRGWLAGMYDGEGARTVIAQYFSHNPRTHARISTSLRTLGFDVFEEARGVRWNGGHAAALKFLNWTGSPRYRERWADEALLISRTGMPDEIVDMVSVGEQEVGCLTTTSGNFVAYGFLSHNCECYQLPGLECFTTVAQNLREEHGFAGFFTTPDRPWVGVLHDQGHGTDPDWECVCEVDSLTNPFTYDARIRIRDEKLMTKERYAIAYCGQLGHFVGRVYTVTRGQRTFGPLDHPHLFRKEIVSATLNEQLETEGPTE